MTQNTAAHGKATRTHSAFRTECAVSININAAPGRIWALLTNAPDFPRWNSTVTSIDGKIAPGEKLNIKVPAAPGRVFSPSVTEFVAEQKMVWSDGMAPMFRGVRTYTLTPQADGSTDFSMNEVFSGLMMPMIGGSLPDFRPMFEQYAADLKRDAERP